MSEQGVKPPPSAEDAIKAALESVERIERERQSAKASGDLDPDSVEVLHADTAPPSGDARAAIEEDVPLVEEGAGKPKSPQEAMLLAMIAAKNEAVKVLEQTQKEAASMRERLLRTTADFENFKKRVSREKQDSIRFANEALLKDLLPVLDNLDRSVVAMSDAISAGLDEKTAVLLVDGVAMVARQFTDTLGKLGVKGFAALGERFNPAIHEAVSTREDKSIPRDSVVEEYQRGYMLHDRLVRPAMVVVSTGGPPHGEAKASSPSGEVAATANDTDAGNEDTANDGKEEEQSEVA
jgi:molecular chaperone GrpE